MLARSFFFLLSFTATVCHKPATSGSNTTTNPTLTADSTFSNPLLASGPDPWVFQKDSFYYYTHTFGNKIALYKTAKMSALKDAPLTTIWTPPDTGAYAKNIWAPELHFLQGKWYVYFAADDGANKNHRLYVLENASPDPTKGTWTFRGKISDVTNKWAIDGSVFQYKNQLYFVWSGWEGDTDVQQDIYMARLKDPFTIDGPRVKISAPTYDWETIGNPNVNEGPEALQNNQGRLFLTYSASGCWTDNYALALLTLKEGGDPMQANDWNKSTTPVFTKNEAAGAYAPGHNGFFKSRDGTEDWIIYHANSKAGQGCGSVRNPRMQKISWTATGEPQFGSPVSIDTKIKKPSGE
ncbi:MAG TPA: glycoside hydrolase family 43 protein [Chitinophagaceae bacterium]|nr:glycoside hydrolase family 43 protein [Chitinophagaceae bacterium]